MSTSAPVYESPRDRTALAREAGLGGLSLPSVLAGVLVAYGAFAALVGAVTAAIGLNTDLAGNDRVTLGVGSAIAASQADTDAVQANLRSLGIPTTGTEWGKVGTVDGIGSLAAMLVGALVGGVLGERWHSKLTRRAVSGKYGPDRADRPTGRPAATMTVTAT